MNITLTRLARPLHGVIDTGGSKSISNRLLIIKAISSQNIVINNLSESDDTRLLLELLKENPELLDCGKAGTTLRFLLALKAFQNKPCLLTGDQRMQTRPIRPLVTALNDLGANITYKGEEGFPPVKVNTTSGLKGGKVSIDASVSSQFLSALALIAPQLDNGLTIELIGQVVSDSYLKMTIDLMQYFGVNCKRENNIITIEQGKYELKEYQVESDWSSASYYYCLCALLPGSQIELFGLYKKSLQGDSIIAKWMEQFGVETEHKADRIIIRSRTVNFPPIVELNFINNPDLFQTFAFFFAVNGCQAVYSGLETLKDKETDRIKAVKTELAKVGVSLVKLPSHMSKKTQTVHYLQEGKASFDKILINTYNDHRMAMAASLLSITSEVEIENNGVVKKSYPNFFSDLLSLV